MVKISSFQALRPIENLADKVPTKPYLNYSESDIVKEKKENPHSFLNIIHEHQIKNIEKRFAKIKSNINKFKKQQIFKKEKKSCLYVYRQSQKKQQYTGLICALDLNDYINNNIKIHEKTIKKRERLFSKYLSITKIHAEPVLITYDNNHQLIKTKHMMVQNKLYDFKTKDKVRHQIWKISQNQEINSIIQFFKKTKTLYIADGHHRMASSSSLINNKKCLAYILPKSNLKTYPFHRALSIEKNTEKTLKNLYEIAGIKNIKSPKKTTKNIQFYRDGQWHELVVKNKQNILENLLVNKLLKNILKPIFSIKDERKNKNIRFIPGNQSIHDITKKIHKKEILFFMNKISIKTIIKIANQNKTTPPKSTFILPKIPSGLIMMELRS